MRIFYWTDTYKPTYDGCGVASKMFSRNYSLRYWKMHGCKKTEYVLRFRGTRGFTHIVGKAALHKDTELSTEVQMITALGQTPAYEVLQPCTFVGTLSVADFVAAFDPSMSHNPFTMFPDDSEMLDVIITVDFGRTMHQHLISMADYLPSQDLDLLCLEKIKVALTSAQMLRKYNFAHQDLKLDNMSKDGRLIDLECACGADNPNRSCRNHPVGWKEHFEDTTEDADVFSCIQSLYVYSGARFQRLPLLGALRAKLFGLSGPETRKLDDNGFPLTYLCHQRFEYVTHQGTIKLIDQIISIFGEDRSHIPLNI